MISVKEAQEKVLRTVVVSGAEVRKISDAGGFVLSTTIFSPVDLPPFDQSAMDGYAVISRDVLSGNTITVVGESAAGKSYAGKMTRGEAVRIFTGAEIPAGANAVVMQEKTKLQNRILLAGDVNLKPGLNIRKKGSQIKKGRLALSKGTLLTPAAIGFLASMGIKNIPVCKKPRIAIVVTGNELQEGGTKLSKGNIYESNATALAAVLKQSGFGSTQTFHVPDDERKTIAALKRAFREADMVLFTGGISVGDYDYVGRVLQKEKVKEVFYKVRQKPGKPLYFGRKNKKYVFGLPGNPASVLTCFYEYVLPAVKKFSGYSNCLPGKLALPVSRDIQKKKGMTYFLKAATDFVNVRHLDGQESYIMRTFAEANCLIVAGEDVEKISAGTPVEVHLI